MSYKYKGAAPHAVALYLPGNFNTESGSVNEACKKKRVVYSTGLKVVVYSMQAIMVY